MDDIAAKMLIQSVVILNPKLQDHNFDYIREVIIADFLDGYASGNYLYPSINLNFPDGYNDSKYFANIGNTGHEIKCNKCGYTIIIKGFDLFDENFKKINTNELYSCTDVIIKNIIQ